MQEMIYSAYLLFASLRTSMPYIETNSLSEHILAFLCSGRSTRVYYAMLREMRIKRYKRTTIDSALSRMKKKGWITKTEGEWKITQNGKKIWQEKDRLGILESPFQKNSPRNTILAFDIPEQKRRERVWLRDQLKVFGYVMLQRSLWRGPGPLPKEFSLRTKKLQIATGIKIFSITSK